MYIIQNRLEMSEEAEELKRTLVDDREFHKVWHKILR